MSDQSLPASQDHPSSSDNMPIPISVNTDGGVYIEGSVNVGGDFVGRDKITHGYTADQVTILLSQISKNFQPKPFDGRCPYRGLEAFGEEDADYFFGREKLTSELVERVKHSRFVVIAGPSGSGKSSLVRAGLTYALKRGALSNSDRWRYEALIPGRSPLDELARVASSLSGTLNAGQDIRTKGLTDATVLHQWAEIGLEDGRDRRALICVDQFEELFTQVAREDERAAFLNLLTHAATVDAGRVTVLFVLRSDFISDCATYPELNALLNQQFFQVGAMQADELVSAIALPALQVGLRIDPDLIAQIINDMQDEPGALPLMQFALKDLFDTQQAAGGIIALTLEGYLARGGLHKALERHADAAFAQLNVTEQELARDIFTKLIQPGRGTQDTRRTAAFEELVPAGADPTLVETVVRRLAEPQLRLITTDEREEKGMRVRTATIAHEKLIDAWPWLKRLVNENREAIALQNEIADDAQAWEQNRRDLSYLYTGARLATAREKLAAKQLALSELAQTFVEISWEVEEAARRTEEARRQAELKKERQNAARLRARNRIITVAGGLALVAALCACLFGMAAGFFGIQSNRSEANAQQQARLALSRQLAVQAVSHLSDRFDLALLLGMEAYRVDRTVEARGSLLTALQYNPRLSTFLRGHFSVTSVAFSPDGEMLASGSGDTILLWNVATHQMVGQPLTGHTDQVTSVAFSPDGKMLASGSDDHTTLLWDVATRQALGPPLIGHTGRVLSVAFSPDGKTLASGDFDGTIILWDVVSHQALRPALTGHTSNVSSVAFSPNGKTLATGSWDGMIILWDVATGQALGQPLIGYADQVTSVAFSPDGKTLASGSGNNTIILWNLATRQPIGQPLIGHTNLVFSVAFSPNGKMLASGSFDRTIILWDVATRQALRSPLTGHVSWVNSVAFSPDGNTLASGSQDGTTILWDMAIHQTLGQPLIGQTGAVYSVAFSPEGKTLASGSDDDTIRLWDMATHQTLGPPLIGQNEKVYSVAFSPDRKTLASGGYNGTILLWDVMTGEVIGQPLTAGLIYSVAFSPDGKMLASGGDGNTITLWNVGTHQALEPPLTGPSDSAFSVAFSPDGKTLAAGSWEGPIILWDVASHQALRPALTGHTSNVSSVAFSPDGKTLAAGSWDGMIILWDVATGQALGQPLTAGFVHSVAFSPDGKTLASGNSDGDILLWDVATHQAVGQLLTGQTDSVLSVAFSPDGKTLASGNSDGDILLWDVDIESWKTRACQIVARNLTQLEWKQYLGDEPYHKTCEQWPEGE